MNAVNAREFFAQRHSVAEATATRLAESHAETVRKDVLRSLAEFCGGDVDLSSVVFDGRIAVFPDGLRLSSYADGYGGSGHKVQGQCPQCGETCWSGPCFTPGEVGEMLEEFKPQDHRCPVPDERRPIAVGDIVNVELGFGDDRSLWRGVQVLTIPCGGEGCWQFVCGREVRVVSRGSTFLITREGEPA